MKSVRNSLLTLTALATLLLLGACLPADTAREPQVGQPVPAISLPGPNEETVSLAALKGQVVLIDFWASWCAPCRHENPVNVDLYELYKKQGFTILSVSLDRKKEPWLKAIRHDGLVWPTHGWDADGQTAARYGVSYIPATFLIDREGRLVARDLHGADLDKALRKLLRTTKRTG